MDTKNLKYPVYAKYASNAYTGGAVLGKAMDVSATYTFDDAALYGDGELQDTDKSFIEGSISIGVNSMLLATRADLLGHTASSPNDGFTGNISDVAPYVGIGFYGPAKGGKFAAIFYPKVQLKDPTDEMAQKTKNTEYKTSKLEGAIMRDDDGDWIFAEVFDLEADAIAWLNGKVGISSTPSSGLSALALTGTGGTLSPAFGAAVRYYTFGGVTGASVTVTATAASHTIKLYVNGVLSQTLLSGTASAAITMAIGTKKLTIVAYESGKSSQTTEIIVVKTA